MKSASISGRAAMPCLIRLIFTLAALLGAVQQLRAEIPAGPNSFVFEGWDGPALQVFTYRPASVGSEAPIMIVMHGVNRDADRYRDEWIAVADRAGLIVAAPQFDAARFAGSQGYNLGGMPGLAEGSAFLAIEPLFDELRERSGSRVPRYYLYGHSAGAQFVHRFLYAVPDARVEQAFAANAGWYTAPRYDRPFPYGLDGSGVSDAMFARALSGPLTILLGREDTQTGANLRSTPEAAEQGANRLERGRSFFSSADRAAREHEVALGWRVIEVPDAGHRNVQMARAVPKLLAGRHSSERKEFLCRSTFVTILADFPGARANDCIVESEDRFRITVAPEVAPPINPSPWYALRFVSPTPGPVHIELRYLAHAHRYVPKFSVDGIAWRAADPASVKSGTDEGGTFAQIVVPPGTKWVAGQEVLDSGLRRSWLEDLARRAGTKVETVGYSHDGRAIELIDTGAAESRSRTLLLLGGQHPPEVSGALAMQSFVEALFAGNPEARRFRARTRIVIVPLLNPDGVDRGHWRSNRGGVDLNRDWGPFTQPETRALRNWIAEQPVFAPDLMIDFHSTARNLFYVQGEDEATRTGDLVARWLARGRSLAPAYEFTIEPANANPGLGTAKNYYFRQFGISSITYEVGDETDREQIALGAMGMAEALMLEMSSGFEPGHADER